MHISKTIIRTIIPHFEIQQPLGELLKQYTNRRYIQIPKK